MSTVPATQEQAKFPLRVLDPNSRQARAFQENVGEAAIDLGGLDKVTVPTGGGKLWVFETSRGNETAEEIIGVPVAIFRRGALWGSEESTSNESKPLLVAISDFREPLKYAFRPFQGTDDEDFGDIDPDVLESCKIGELPNGQSIYSWQDLPYNEFDTSTKGAKKGKRAKETRQVLLFRETDVRPLTLSIPPTSLRDFDKRIQGLPISYYECVLGFSLEKTKGNDGPDYSKVVVRMVNELNEEHGGMIVNQLRPPFVQAVAERKLPAAQCEAMLSHFTKTGRPALPAPQSKSDSSSAAETVTAGDESGDEGEAEFAGASDAPFTS